MNNQNMMMKKKPDQGAAEYVDPNAAAPQQQDFQAFQSGFGMVKKGAAPSVQYHAGRPPGEQAAPEKQLPAQQPAQASGGVPGQSAQDALRAKTEKLKAKTAAAVDAASAAIKKQTPKQDAPSAKPGAPTPARTPNPPGAQQQAPRPAAAAGPIRAKSSLDALSRSYMDGFKLSLGLDLSPSICFENMRRMCEANTKDPDKTLYFLENTYRVSTILYLASNLPVMVVASVLAETNRKNILKYVTTEVENGAKPYDELLALRTRRWSRKYESMSVNDAMTVTPGATMMTPELASAAAAELAATCRALKRFDGELSNIVAKFDEGTKNDVVYIYSNWWYLLQGFENVPEIRTYLMTITDDTRKNLKI